MRRAPITGGGGGRGGGGPTTPGGAPVVFEHLETTKRMLDVQWDYPVPKLELTQQLARADALAAIRGSDPRPLLILRECNVCKGSDEALFSRSLSNEKTALLTRWFHCVKLPTHVTQAAHPFSALFRGERPPHFCLLDADGERGVLFDGTQTQSDLWAGMYDVLRRAYERDAETAVEQIAKLLPHYDHLDSLEGTLKQLLDAEIQKSGAESSDAAAIRAKIEKIASDRRETLAREMALADLRLRAAPTAKAAGAPGDKR